jgi:hypothetical protein
MGNVREELKNWLVADQANWIGHRPGIVGLEAVFIRLDDIISQAITLGGAGNQDASDWLAYQYL